MTFTLTDGQVKWIDALKSGDYDQVEGALQKDDGYCCLGVLCTLVDPDGWVEDTDHEEWQYWWKGDAETPPVDVAWDVALRSRDGALMVNVYFADGHWHLVGDDHSKGLDPLEMEAIDVYTSLVAINDSGVFTFEQIAQLLEEQSMAVFHTPEEQAMIKESQKYGYSVYGAPLHD